jgi:hypothetical protein
MLTNSKKLQQMCQKPDAGCCERLEELRLEARRYGYQLQPISLKRYWAQAYHKRLDVLEFISLNFFPLALGRSSPS